MRFKHSQGENCNTHAHIFHLIAPPERVTQPTDTSLNSGDTIQFLCSAFGNPLPSITWKKDGNILFNSTNVIITDEAITDTTIQSTLSLINVSIDDNAVYTCDASNSVGNNSGNFSVEVLGMFSSHYSFSSSSFFKLFF